MKRLIALILAALLMLSACTTALAQTYKDKTTVKNVQQALNDAGYNCGKPDGSAGKKTKAAIKDYQAANGLDATGEIDDALLQALGVDAPGKKTDETDKSDAVATEESTGGDTGFNAKITEQLKAPLFFADYLSQQFASMLDGRDQQLVDAGISKEQAVSLYNLQYDPMQTRFMNDNITELRFFSDKCMMRYGGHLDGNQFSDIGYIALTFENADSQSIDGIDYVLLATFLHTGIQACGGTTDAYDKVMAVLNAFEVEETTGRLILDSLDQYEKDERGQSLVYQGDNYYVVYFYNPESDIVMFGVQTGTFEAAQPK